MKITALQEYGLRCVLQLAREGLEQPLGTGLIAKREGISRDYVEKILSLLRKRNVVRSVRGMHGGYVLGRSPKDISVGEIVMALRKKPIRMQHVKDEHCHQFSGKKDSCVHLDSCTIRTLWSAVVFQIYSILEQIPLSFLIGKEEEIQSRLEALKNKKVEV